MLHLQIRVPVEKLSSDTYIFVDKRHFKGMLFFRIVGGEPKIFTLSREVRINVVDWINRGLSGGEKQR